MSQTSAIFSTDDDEEILNRLYLVANTDYTRPWFAWANSYFAEMLLDLAQRKPGLIFKTNEPYEPGEALRQAFEESQNRNHNESSNRRGKFGDYAAQVPFALRQA
ncbi:hypothetical protein K438DRAFT_1778075 [Mycena galopus ATCC 62051]|nr:hypothetical protein K438DRAFT_1778075 [Mycena galopus ATCC 62051]